MTGRQLLKYLFNKLSNTECRIVAKSDRFVHLSVNRKTMVTALAACTVAPAQSSWTVRGREGASRSVGLFAAEHG